MNPPKKPSPAKPNQRSSYWKYIRFVLRCLVILIPVVAMGRLIKENMVNLPYMDDYMFTPMLEKFNAGTLTLQDFFMVQMEHRLAFVRAVILIRHWLSPLDITPQMWFTYALLIGTGINIAYILTKTAGPFKRWWPVMALATLALFSPVQYQIVLWAMMFQVACPAFFLSLTLAALLSDLPPWLRWLVGVTGAICAMLSFATGILLWLLPLPVIIWSTRLRPRAKAWFVALWLLAFGVSMGLYFHDLKNEVDPAFAYKQSEEATLHRDLSSFLEDPVRSYTFFARYLGGHLARGTSGSLMDAAAILGSCAFILWVAAGIWWLLNLRKNQELVRQLTPWICFGGYSVGAAMLTAMGRVWATSTGDNAILPRYTIHPIPLTVALAAIGWIIARDLRTTHPRSALRVQKLQVAAGVVLLGLQCVSWIHGVRMMAAWESSRLRVATNTLFYKLDNVSELNNVVGYHLRAIALDDMGLLKPAMLKADHLSQFKSASKPLSSTTAKWKNFTVDRNDDLCTVEGFAALPDRSRVADGVFFAYRKEGGAWHIFHVSQVEAMPIFLMHSLARDLQNLHTPGDFIGAEPVCGFKSTFNLSELPKGNLELGAWAYDYRRGRVYPIVGRFTLNTESAKVRRLPFEVEDKKGRRGSQSPAPAPAPPPAALQVDQARR